MNTNTRYLHPHEMAALAQKAREEASIKQAAAAERLEVNPASIWKAENDTSGRYVKLQARMIRELGGPSGWECEGPLWRVQLPSGS